VPRLNIRPYSLDSTFDVPVPACGTFRRATANPPSGNCRRQHQLGCPDERSIFTLHYHHQRRVFLGAGGMDTIKPRSTKKYPRTHDANVKPQRQQGSASSENRRFILLRAKPSPFGSANPA
jgi:hypothetical protein